VLIGQFNVIGSLQNLDSADAEGDHYGTRSCLLIDGVGTLAAAALGSCFPTTIYIGHSGFKGLGARSGYSWLNGLVMAAGCFLGLFGLISILVPIDAGMAIVLYIGIAMTSQTFQATPSRHAPAVVLGIPPGLAGWGSQLLKAGLRTGGLGTNARPFNHAMITQLSSVDVWAALYFA
jgi:adenine/guanine/hypoxanthine permease